MTKGEIRELQQVLAMLLHDVGRLRAGELAMMRIIKEITPHLSPEIVAIICRYPEYREKMHEDALLHLEQQFPSLAALISSFDDSDSAVPPPDDGAHSC